jgi:methylated-DNA-[protein]-cysteine S-methyltransferase
MAAATDEARLTGGRALAPPRYTAKLRAPFAVLGIVSDGRVVQSISYLPRSEREQDARDRIAARAVREIERYLADPAHRFSVPLAARGTVFQQQVWAAIGAIPVGESRTYAEIARSVRSAARAVGQACGRNPIALIVPCHRVVGSRGALGGFMHAADGAAIDVKRWLLVHEGYRFGA